MDVAIEELIGVCEACQSVKSAPPMAPLHPWVWLEKPWQRIHVDFAGPFCGRMFLLLVDAHSKWPEVIRIDIHNFRLHNQCFEEHFYTHGLPDQMVTNNGPQFTSSEFTVFTPQNGIKHIFTAPYHPSSNGAVERFIQTFNEGRGKEWE